MAKMSDWVSAVKTSKEEARDKYDIIKGKAFALIGEFQKVYPKAPAVDIGKRIHDEVWYAANDVMPNAKEIDTEKLHGIINEIRSCMGITEA